MKSVPYFKNKKTFVTEVSKAFEKEQYHLNVLVLQALISWLDDSYE